MIILITSIVAAIETFGYQTDAAAISEEEKEDNKNKGTKHVFAQMDDPTLAQCPPGTTKVPGSGETFLVLDATKSKGKSSGTFQVIFNVEENGPEGHFTKDGKITKLKLHADQFSLKGTETKDEICQGSEVPVAVTITGGCPHSDIKFETKSGEIVNADGEDGVIRCQE
jgi:hypothetical protein